MGIGSIKKPLSERIKSLRGKIDLSFFQKRKYGSSIFFGFLIGLICGIIGAGGGVMILLVLMFILGYQIHVAVGTSVLMMAFIALSGAVSHAYYGTIPPYAVLIGCISGAIGARSAATFANLASEEKLGRVAGVVFLILGIILTVNEIFYD